MNEFLLGAGIASAAIASFGLWWFRLVLGKNLQSLPKTTRLGVYALLWLAYFVLVMIVIQRNGAGA